MTVWMRVKTGEIILKKYRFNESMWSENAWIIRINETSGLIGLFNDDFFKQHCTYIGRFD